MKVINKIAIGIFIAFGIGFGQSSSISLTDVSRTNVKFGNEQSALFYSLAHDSVDNRFVNGFNLGVEIAKYSPNGQSMWQITWDENDTAESVEHQMVYSGPDNSIISATLQEEGTHYELVAKFDGESGKKIWQDTISIVALEAWGVYTLALQESHSAGTISIIRDIDGSIQSSFSINSYLGSWPMMKALGDTLYVFANPFFGKFLLPSGKLVWQVPTTDFATRAVATHGTIDSKGNAYVYTSDSWDQVTGRVLFAAAKYSSDGKKIWSNKWYGWSDTSMAGGASRYNLNNWANGIAINESLDMLACFGGTQMAGTAGYETNDQSAYLAILDAGSGDTLATSKWDDGSSVSTLWNDGYFNSSHQLVLLGYGCAPGKYLIADNFIKVFGVIITDRVAEQPIQPTSFTLSQNYPNPFNPTTTISFRLPQRLFVTLKVFDVMGREISTIVSETLSPGNYSRQWSAENFGSGVYFYRLQAGTYSDTKKLLFLK